MTTEFHRVIRSHCRSFALTVFHAALVFDLAGLCGIASRAGVPLVAALFAAVGLLRLREI
jgi:hypothetical protein